MCGKACSCAGTGSAVPAAALAVVVVCAAVSSAAALITGALVAILATLGAACAVGVAGLIYLLRRDRVQMWQSAPARQAAARPALSAPRTATAIAAPGPRAIEAPRTAGLSPVHLSSVPLADGFEGVAAREEMITAGK